jgi:uncharacterized protein YbbK (DUF523 family)
MNILVSACLLGVNCKYSGGNNMVKELCSYMQNVNFIPICPEQLGGLTTPRPPAEIIEDSKVINKAGQDVTRQFLLGAEETLKIAKLYNCKYAILKQRSPSCGSSHIYDGSFQGKVKHGMGLTASLLMKNDIKVYSEENFIELLKDII